MTHQPRPFRDRLNAWLSHAGLQYDPHHTGRFFKSLFYTLACIIGWLFGYVPVTIGLAIFYVVMSILLTTMEPLDHFSFMKPAVLLSRAVFHASARFFAWAMGWGFGIDLWKLPLRILGSAIEHFPPSRMSFRWFWIWLAFWFYTTGRWLLLDLYYRAYFTLFPSHYYLD